MKITSKQDGVYPRTPAALAQQYDFGKVFDEITGIRLTVEEQEAMVKAELSLKLGYNDTGQIVSMLNASADIINISGNRLTIDSTYFSLEADGTLTATNGNFTGEVNATAGTIGGCVIKDGLLEVPMANIKGKLTVDHIDTGMFTAKLDEIEERVGDAEDSIKSTNTSLSVMSGQIESKVSQTDFDVLGNTVTTHETRITQTEKDITSKVSQTEFNTLNGTVTTHETRITQTEADIKATVTKDTFDKLGNRVSTAETQISANATAIEAKAAKTDLDSLGNTVTQHDASIKANAESILAKVSQTDFDDLGERVSQTESNITALSGEISARVTYTEFDSLGAEVAAVQGEISLKVDEENLISLINMAANEITITSDYFSLSADGTISATSGYIGNFTIGDGIYSEQESLTGEGNGYPGVYIGTDGIGCGNGSFFVNSSGYFYAGDWRIIGGSLSNENGLYLSADSGGAYIKLIENATTSTTIYPDSISTGSMSLSGNITFGGMIYTKSSSDVSWSPGYSDHVDVLEDIDKRKRLTFKNGILTAVTSI